MKSRKFYLLGRMTSTQLEAWCPFCNKFHLHGKDPAMKHGISNAVHKSAHCFEDSGSPYQHTGYYVFLAKP